MGVEQVDHRPERSLREWYDVMAAARSVDVPDQPSDPFEELLVDSREERQAFRQEHWLLRERTEPVAAALIEVPLRDNTENVALLMSVHPRQRRRGHGRRLLDQVVQRARELGRSRLVIEVSEPLVPGEPCPGAQFAVAAGASRALDEVRRVLDLEGLDDARLSALEAEARSRSAGYTLRQWSGPTPDELIDDEARLIARMTTDAPLGDLQWEPEVWDAARLREREGVTERKRRLRVAAAVRHEATGQLVAVSELAVSTLQPQTAYQWNTIVLSEHRGHRLGMLVKATNLRLLRREVPAATRIMTWNAESNTHMVAINDALGFRPVGRTAEWQLDLGRGPSERAPAAQ